MPVTLPPTTKSLGNKVVILLDAAPANPKAPTKAELNAGLFAQCHIYGQFEPTPSQNTGAAPTKLCSKQEEDELGRVKYPAFDVQYSYVPQSLGTPGAAGNEMYEQSVPGTYQYAYIVDGLDGEATGALTTGAVVNRGFKVEVGEYREGQTGTGEFDEFSCTQSYVPKGGRLVHNYPTPAA